MEQNMERKTQVVYRLLGDDDINDVIELLIEHYLPYEPMSKCLSLTDEEMRWYADDVARVSGVVLQRLWELLNFIQLQDVVPQGVSIGAYDSLSKKMCGLSMGKLKCYKIPSFRRSKVPEKVLYMQRFEEWSESSLEEDLDSTNFVIGDLSVVSSEYSNQGIGTELAKRHAEFFVERGFDFCVGFSTSVKSMGIVQRLGYKCIKKIDMTSYKDPYTGVAVFAQAEAKDNCVHVMVIDLQKPRSNKLKSKL
uniref:uncharacterized protein LOC108950041 isoform X1 n=1 Tax=Ciona intestinalis TaxID=7719 RepID=UPI000EF4B86F|nr:uncharacterized protein LOC108950041 isoform X1 [Ciona intestinalis]|eukprot:XP_026691204.1 uncharacterized protein LOC108950041 isoform X1 [Ciona intestinalis]